MAAASYMSQTRLHFYLTPAEDAAAIQHWLDNNLPTGKHRVFYGSFINWCAGVISRARFLATKYQPGQQAIEQETIEVLRQVSVDTIKFTGLMECYANQNFKGGGFHSGTVKRDNCSELAMNAAQRQLFERVFSRSERAELYRQKGDTLPLFVRARMERVARKSREKRARRLDRGVERQMGELDLGEEVEDLRVAQVKRPTERPARSWS